MLVKESTKSLLRKTYLLASNLQTFDQLNKSKILSMRGFFCVCLFPGSVLIVT